MDVVVKFIDVKFVVSKGVELILFKDLCGYIKIVVEDYVLLFGFKVLSKEENLNIVEKG